MRATLLAAALAVACGAPAFAAESRLLMGFETPGAVASIEIRSGAGELSDQHVTQGSYSLRVPADDYLIFFHLPQDWSGYDALEVDAFAETPGPVSVSLLVGDAAWQANSTYWNRHNSSLPLRPGANTISIPLGGLYRGEAGSRNNDIPTNIDVSQIVRLDLGFRPVDGGGFIYLDNMRLTRWSRPESVRAFDFGPADQSVAPGFTAVAPDAVYSADRGWGWAGPPAPNRAWDVTFPTRLLQDSVDVGDAAFRVDLAPGRYRALVIFEPLGYWSGEQARFTWRTVHAGAASATTRRDEWGLLDHAYHFQDTEPLPGADLWDVYMGYLFAPVELTIDSSGGPCDFTVASDGALARRIAALILYPTDDATAAAWVREALAAQRDEFQSRVVELPLPETENAAAPTAADRARGFQLFAPPVEQTVYFSTRPTPDQICTRLGTYAAQGERRSLTIAVRPLVDLGPTGVEMSDLRGPGGAVIPAARATVSVVRHLPSRPLGSLMYRVTPRYLVRASEVELPADLTRQLWLTITVPADAAPGRYEGRLALRPAGGAAVEIPVSLDVLPFALEEADFTTGFFGIEPDLPVEGAARDALQNAIFAMLRERGFTSFTGGPPIVFHGLDESGAPVLDFAAADAFIAAAKAAGFRREFNNYGSFVVEGLYDRYGYVKGETGATLEARYGVPYEEIARRVWAAVEQHAKEHDWLPFTYTMCDETRVLEQAQKQLELMRLFNRVSPWLRTTGGYSVSFQPTDDPLSRAHQEFFRTLDISMLNSHDETVMEKARELGKGVYIYNQGKGRYEFGLYQWSEQAKGVGGRYEWIMSIQHGYGYFDLDGREPDTGVIFYASDGLRPAVELEQCAEGMNDFRYLQTLADLAALAERTGAPAARTEAEAAKAFLRGVTDRIALNERRKPEWLDLDAVRAEAARRIAALKASLEGRPA